MTTLGLLLAVSAPFLAAPLLFLRGRPGAVARAVAPWAALPALLLSAVPVDFPEIELPWLLIGSRFELDPVGRIFLIVAALLWTTAGVYARGYIDGPGRKRFLFYFLVTMSGNLGVTVAADAISFYFFFALMTFAGYGLIVYRRDSTARRAGHVYLVLAVAGEAILLVGLLLAARAAGTNEIAAIPAGVASSGAVGVTTLCLLLGFAIKAGAVPLHVWLPLAHPVAPTPASAVLSGSMINAGVLGWLRFLPLGEIALPGWGTTLIALGLLAAFFGVLVGVTQIESKTVLAYSSISQMGLMNMGVGVALAVPAAAVPMIAAITLFAAHHGLAKAALFLGAGIVGARGQSPMMQRAVIFGLTLSALTLAGVPLTSGHLAKHQLKAMMPLAPEPWPLWLDLLIPLSAAATTLLMLRFLVVTVATRGDENSHSFSAGLWAPWVVLLGGSAVSLWTLPRIYPVGSGAPPALAYPDSVLLDTLPVVGTVALCWLLARRWKELSRVADRPMIAPGDILGPVEAWLRSTTMHDRLLEPIARPGLVPGLARRWYRLYSESDSGDALIRLELRLTRWAAGSALLLLLTAALLVLIAGGFG
ncbi:MAG: complex I subunit 5 family protein [Gemmatimonadota bacterium]